MLRLLRRLDKYSTSENRPMMAWSLLDALREGRHDERGCIVGLERPGRFDDSEPTVRGELIEQTPHSALFCQENRPSTPYAFFQILPICG